MDIIKDKAAIVGIGVHKFSKDSGMTEMEMACLAIRSALDDAGLTPDSIDGFVEYGEECFDEVIICRSMGIGNLTFHGDVRWDGGAACSIVQRAAMAVAAGMANNVVVVRSVNDASLRRKKKTWGEIRPWESIEEDFYNPYGLVSDSGRIGMTVRRYMHEYNIDRDSFGWVSEVLRENGARNPNSMFYSRHYVGETVLLFRPDEPGGNMNRANIIYQYSLSQGNDGDNDHRNAFLSVNLEYILQLIQIRKGAPILDALPPLADSRRPW